MTPGVLRTARALDRELAAEQAFIDRILAKLRPERTVGRRRTGSPRRFWTTAEDRELQRLYPDTSTAELARRFGRSVLSIYQRARLKMGIRKSAAYLASPAACRLRREPHPGIQFRFPKGHVPANKGLRRPGFAPGRMSETQFKNGQQSHNWVPVGTERKDDDGYLKRKISDDRSLEPRFNWRYVHTLTWEAKNGPVPRGCAVAFKNGDNTDIRDENLELVSREELMRRNSVHRLPKALAEVVQLRGALVRQINRRARA